MSKYQELLFGKIKFKEGKKWKERFCVINKLNDAADHLRLHLTKDKAEYNRLRQSTGNIEDLPFYGLVYGFEHGRHVDGVRNVIVFVCCESVLLLAFENFEEMNRWRQQLHIHLIDVWYRVRLDRALEGSKLITGEDCYLHVQSSRIVLVSESASKLIWAWNYRNIKNYGIVEDSFIVVGASSSGKGRGTHYFSVDGKDKLEALYADVHAYTCGSIPPSVILQRNSEESSVLRPYLSKPIAPLGSKSLSHSSEESNGHNGFGAQSDNNQCSSGVVATSSTEFDLRKSNSVSSYEHRQIMDHSRSFQSNDSNVTLRSPEIKIPPSRKVSDKNQSDFFKTKHVHIADEFRSVSNAGEVFDNEENLFFPQDIVQEEDSVADESLESKTLHHLPSLQPDFSNQAEYAVPNALPGHIYANINSSIHVHDRITTAAATTTTSQREFIKQGLKIDVLPSRHNLPIIRSVKLPLPSSSASSSSSQHGGYIDMKETAGELESSSPVYMTINGNAECRSSTPEDYLLLKTSDLHTTSGSWETLPLPKKPTLTHVGPAPALQQTMNQKQRNSYSETSAPYGVESATMVNDVPDHADILKTMFNGINRESEELTLASVTKTLRHRSISENSTVDSFDNQTTCTNNNDERQTTPGWTTLTNFQHRSYDFKRSISQEGHKVASPRTGQEYVPRQRLTSSSSSCGAANGAAVVIDGSDSLPDSFVDLGVAGTHHMLASHEQQSIRNYVNVGPNVCNDPFPSSDIIHSMTSSWHSYYQQHYHTPPSTSLEHPYANLDMRANVSRITSSTTSFEPNPSVAAAAAKFNLSSTMAMTESTHSCTSDQHHAAASFFANCTPESAINAKRIEYALLDHSPGHSAHNGSGSTPLSQHLPFALTHNEQAPPSLPPPPPPLFSPPAAATTATTSTVEMSGNTSTPPNYVETAQLNLTSPVQPRPTSSSNSASNYFQVDFERMECLKHTTDEWRRQKAAEEKAFLVSGNNYVSAGQASGSGAVAAASGIGLRRISIRSFRSSAQGRKANDVSSTAS